MRNKYIAALTLLAGLLLLLLGTGCGQNHQDNDDQTGSSPEPGVILGPSDNPDVAVVDAVINVLDYEIAGNTASGRGGSAAGAPGGPGGSGSGKQIMAKIINPGDDILSQIIATPGVRFKLSVGGGKVSRTSALSTALQIEFKVVEDLNGDKVGGDTIIQTVPVSIIAGKVAKVDLTIRRAGMTDVGSGSAPDPGDGELVYTSAEREDALGIKDDFFGTNYATGEVLYDVDGNEFLSPGTDQVLTDENMNGWPDLTEAPYFDPEVNQPSAPPAFASGMVIAVDLAGYSFDMQTDDGRTVHVQVEPSALIAPIGPDGELLGQVVLDPSMVGRHVQVDGIPLDAQSMIALRVILDPDKPVR